jgi:uncharacterized protein YndB with AHSA1/START domain
MKVAAFIIGALVLLVMVIVVTGYALPQNHTATRERSYRASPASVFAAITTPASYPEWRTGVKQVELLAPVDQRVSFREVGADGTITYVFEEIVPERRVVSRIADRSLPFGGSWTYDLAPTDGGTTLRITEKGEVYNPIFRFMSRFVLGHNRTMDTFLADLERRVASGR